MRERPGGWVVACLVALTLVVASCARIPTDGPVTPGRSGEQDANPVSVIAPEPGRGASPEEIARGFVNAAVATDATGARDREYATARTFMTVERAREWQPDAGTVVYSGQAPRYAVSADGRAVPTGDAVGSDVDRVVVSVSVGVVATIDARGRYTQAPPGTTQQAQMTLVRADGQWRIDDVPDGVLVAESYLRLAYQSFRLYFVDLSRGALVPEIRWFPRRMSNATVLARELLAGPSPWLAGAVSNAFPEGTALAAPGSVRIEDGVAVVDMTSQALRTTPTERGLMVAQLRATLLPVADVASVSLLVSGSQIEVPTAPAPVAVAPAVDPWPVALQDGALVRVRGGVVEPVEGLPDLDGLVLSHPGVSQLQPLGRPQPQRYAVLAAERSQLRVLLPGQPAPATQPLLTGADLTAPSFDPYGWVWSTSALSTGTVSAAGPDGTVRLVAADWLAGRRVVSLRASRDGARVVVASTDVQGGAHVEVAGVVRDGDLAPLSLAPTGALPVAVHLDRVQEAVWLGETDVAVLGRAVGDDVHRVHLIEIGGPYPAPLGPPPDAIAVTAGAGPSTILVWTTSGVLEQAGSAWVPARGYEVARQPSFAG